MKVENTLAYFDFEERKKNEKFAARSLIVSPGSNKGRYKDIF